MNETLIEQYKNRIQINKFSYKREIFYMLSKELVNRNIVLVGLRQLGKTILAEQLVYNYLQENKFNAHNFLYLNLKSFGSISYEKIQEYINGHNFNIVFIDEIQAIQNWSNLVQVLVDMNQDTRFIFTGSNASSLSRETAFNRVKIFNIYPLTFNEYKNMWNSNNFRDYLYYGTYPPVAFYGNLMIQYKEMIHSLIIDKIAIEDNEGIDISKFRNFTKSISNYIGNEIKSSKLAVESNLTRPTVSIYIKVMKEASLIKTISKYNDRNRNSKHKVYFTDKSMLCYFNNDFLNEDKFGSLIENQVFSHLCTIYNSKYGENNIQYYRNDQSQEIDFIIHSEKRLIEVKYKKKIDLKKLSSDLNLIIKNNFREYNKQVITIDQEGQENGWTFIPLIKFLSEK